MENSLRSDVLEWDIYNWARAVSFWDERADEVCSDLGVRVLELGARGGGISLYWALKGARVVSSDITDEFFDQARDLHRQYGVTDQITYEVINATDIPYEGVFDVVTFKSVLGGVGWGDNYANQQLMMEQIYRALKPGGYLFFCENMVASRLHMLGRKLFTNRVGGWRYLKLNEMVDLTKEFSELRYETFGVAGVFGRTPLMSKLLSSVDARFDSLIGPDSRYIVSAICRK